ncbi:fimbrial protein [Gallibacterium trehalosifermentans]|uniref:Fimbrial protein n=1 Tax=Gallibacterium trehalosifermentans TaxID=516935 RepID=A0ABV6GYC9_9PAST
MKKLALVALVGAAFAISQGASAKDGTVNFTGEIVDSSCVVKTESQNLTVTLPRIDKKALTADGQVAGKVPFEITLESCPATVTSQGDKTSLDKVKAYFHYDTSKINANGRVINTYTEANSKTKAANVDIQILDSADKVIDISAVTSDSNSVENSAATTLSNGTVKLRYYAQYYATGVTSPGLVSGSVDYTIAYQ